MDQYILTCDLNTHTYINIFFEMYFLDNKTIETPHGLRVNEFWNGIN